MNPLNKLENPDRCLPHPSPDDGGGAASPPVAELGSLNTEADGQASTFRVATPPSPMLANEPMDFGSDLAGPPETRRRPPTQETAEVEDEEDEGQETTTDADEEAEGQQEVEQGEGEGDEQAGVDPHDVLAARYGLTREQLEAAINAGRGQQPARPQAIQAPRPSGARPVVPTVADIPAEILNGEDTPDFFKQWAQYQHQQMQNIAGALADSQTRSHTAQIEMENSGDAKWVDDVSAMMTEHVKTQLNPGEALVKENGKLGSYLERKLESAVRQTATQWIQAYRWAVRNGQQPPAELDWGQLVAQEHKQMVREHQEIYGETTRSRTVARHEANKRPKEPAGGATEARGGGSIPAKKHGQNGHMESLDRTARRLRKALTGH